MDSPTRHLSVARAARLAGVPRAEIQAHMRDGRLPSFDGSVSVADLLSLYPDLKLEDDREFERVSRIRENAFGRRVLDRVLPAAPILAHQLNVMGNELGETKALLKHYRAVLDAASGRLARLVGTPADASDELAALQDLIRQGLDGEAHPDKRYAILTEAQIYRAASAHVLVEPSRQEFLIDGRDSVLQAGLRAGLALDYGCEGGTCGRCRARLVSGNLRATQTADFTLSEAERNQGIFLMCSNSAVTDLVIEATLAAGPGDVPEQAVTAKLSRSEKTGAGDNVRALRLRVARGQRLRFLPGQRARLTLDDGTEGIRAIASCPCDGTHLEFHFDRADEDTLAQRVFEGIRVHATVQVTGPFGRFTLDEASGRPIVCIASGTEFAGIKSIIEHAQNRELEAPIHLYWTATPACGHYAEGLLRAWKDSFDNFAYTLLTDEAGSSAQLLRLAKDHPNLGDFDVYLAAAAGLISGLRETLLALGADPAHLHVSESA